jgi:hypothetical protein
MLTIFHHPKTKNFCMASFLTRKKTLATSQASFFFFARKLAKQKVVAIGWWKSSASIQRQATHLGKISGCRNFCGGCNYKFSRHQWNWDLMCMCTARKDFRQGYQDRTARIRLPGHGWHARTARRRQPGQDRKDRTARTGQAIPDRQNRIGRTGQAKQDRQNRTGRTRLSGQDSRTAKAGQDCQDRTPGQLGQNKKERTAKTIQAEQDRQDRTARPE